MLAGRSEIVTALGRINFALDCVYAVCLSPITSEERTTPLLGQIVTDVQFIGQRNAIEDTLLERFAMAWPRIFGRRYCCDRGFYH